MSQKGFSAIILILVLLMIGLTAGVFYYLGMQKSSSSPSNQPEIASSDLSKSASSSAQEFKKDLVAETVISYLPKNGKDLLKIDIKYLKDKVKSDGPIFEKQPDTSEVFSEDKDSDPVNVTDIDDSKFESFEIVRKSLEEEAGIENYLLADRIFSFRKIPNSSSLLVVIEWSRMKSKEEGKWEIGVSERVLYLYDIKTKEVKELMVFSDSPAFNSPQYPKISQFNSDGKLVEIKLYSCWNCGGHMPQTLLMDLSSLRTKNIGEVLDFKWTGSHEYSYKEAKVIMCDSEGAGDCYEKPEKLPEKSGVF